LAATRVPAVAGFGLEGETAAGFAGVAAFALAALFFATVDGFFVDFAAVVAAPALTRPTASARTTPSIRK
jgi:hypothetical protein